MAVLRIEKGKQQGLLIEVIENGAPMVMGRDASADIVLEDERASRQHAKILRERGEWIVEDLGSRNGLLYRGQTVRRTGIRDGDLFQIGSTVLKFRESEHVDPLPGGELLGARLQRLLGGEAGVLTYHGQQLAMDRPVRIDVTDPRRPFLPPEPSGGGEAAPALIEAIQQAVAAAEKIQHPAVLTLLRAEIPNDQGGATSALRWSEGRRLAEAVEEVLAWPLPGRIRFYRRLAEAILERAAPSLCYPIGLAHVLLDGDAGPQVAALDLSALLALLRGQVQDLPAFPPYLAPEAYPGGSAPAWPILVYNLGAIGYHLLTGGPPMGEGSTAEVLERHRRVDPAPAILTCPELPAGLSEILSRMLAKDPAARPGAPAEILGALSEVDSRQMTVDRKEEPAKAPPAKRPPPAPSRQSAAPPPPRKPTGVRPAPKPPPAAIRKSAGLPLGAKIILWPALWAALVLGLRYATRLILEN
jgi:pSer/pThr/pTyr-binding forkhead associated (FHA) protein